MATTSIGTNIDERDSVLKNSSTTFKKRAGTTDVGKDYEHLYIANLVLKLVTDDDVADFNLSSNDSEYGSFDDVVVDIKFEDRRETVALQLKHISKAPRIKIEQLNAPSGNFSIEKYYEKFKNEPKLSERRTKMVLFTNSKLNDEHVDRLKFGKLVQCEQESLLSVLKSRGQCCKLEPNENSLEKYGHFFENLYLYSDQPDVKELETCTLETFKKKFSGNETTFREYVYFINQWSTKEGKKFALNKSSMKCVIALCAFSPFIRPLHFVPGGSLDVKRNTFREAISKCNFTVIDKNNFEKIDCLWSNAVDDIDDGEEMIKVNNMYQLVEGGIEKKESLYNKDETKVSKLLWLLGKSPLVVEGCPQVYETIKICQVQNLIVLDNRETYSHIVRKKSYHDDTNIQLFQKLSDLKKHSDLYTKILTNFTYSLEGQKDVSLKNLLEVCEDSDNFITTDDLVEMLEAPLAIGKHKDALPPSHIERKLTKILIDVKFLKNIADDTVVLVDCVTDLQSFKRFLPNLVISEVNDISLIRNTIHEQKIYICGNDVLQEKFSALCNENSENRFHHFRYLDNHRLEWIESGNCGPERGYIVELEKFRLQSEFMEYTIREHQFFRHSRQNINIICADPGMGKSTLMKSLKSRSSSSKWIILIYARNHALHFRKHGSNVENFLKYILEETVKECTNPFHQKVFKTMLEQNQIQLVWDGLDEASDTTQISILTLVTTFSEKGVKQWLTSRNNLKEMLENKLGMFARNIKQFSEDEQQEYIKNRLRMTEDELSETFNKIRKNIMSFPNYEILGIPLQIYMLTELFLNDRDKYLPLLDGIFTVLDLYEHFVQEKFHVLYNDKKEITLRNEQNNQHFENEKNTRMNHYKSLAASYYIYNSLIDKIINKLFGYGKTNDSFLEKIKNEGDDVGLICRVISKYDVEFVHNSYGEYFAALYLFEHETSKARDQKFISDSRFNNIRFFLDLMLSRNSKCLVGVIYKNITIVEAFTDADLLERDMIGRDIWEVACAWSKKYPIVENTVLVDYKNFDREWIINNNKQAIRDLNYRNVVQKFYKFRTSGNICYRKLMIFLPFLVPLYDGNQFGAEYSAAILYYAIRFDVPIIFECIENSLPLRQAYDTISPRSILALAFFNRSARILKKLLSEERFSSEWDCVEELLILNSEIDEIFTFALHLPEFRVDVRNFRGQSLGHFACEKNLIKTLRSLIIIKETNLNVRDRSGRRPVDIAYENGNLDVLKLIAKINILDENGCLVMHSVCEDGDLMLVEILVANGAELNLPDENGRLPIHYVTKNCDYGLNIIPFLRRNGARLDVPDGKGRLPIHDACEYGLLSMVELLVSDGAKVDVPDKNGRLPIHYACEHGELEVVEFLVMNGAQVDVPDGDGRLPMHYACKNYNHAYVIVQFLRIKDAKVDAPDVDGRQPIHYACEHGDEDVVELLVESGVKVDVPDGDGQLPIHYACKNVHNKYYVILFLLQKGAKVDLPDGWQATDIMRL
ncbi:hypothetical protein Zmor_019013 [Zophobas morio]|uniref:NACHT domain-containing protein n=1 Tax=Zophobas morio TaxID=2755281 RepID=A0AA38IF86_9CUCU|nr:hypothetical protein Zmor_019013 [Zophobas morio]